MEEGTNYTEVICMECQGGTMNEGRLSMEEKGAIHRTLH